MAGQSVWSAPGSTNNAYVVNPVLSKEIYYLVTYATIFGRVNGLREVKTQKVLRGDQSVSIDAGNDSPVWEKDLTNMTGEVRFTMREENKGMASYGDSDVKPGDFGTWMHAVCHTRQVDSPAYPIPGFESSQNIYEVVSDLVSVEKNMIKLWMSKEIDLDGFRACLGGASRGILITTDGGKGITLYGGSAGAQRAPYNTYVEGQTALTAPSATLTTHNTALAAKLATLANDDKYAFTYESHQRNSGFIDDIGFKPVKVGGREYRAICLTDPLNVARMGAVGGDLFNLMKDAWTRGKDNPALNGLKNYELDDILYIPVKQLAYFRPTVNAGVTDVTWGCGYTQDPRSKTFTNSSNITISIYMGAGALLRARRKGVNIDVDQGKFGKGAAYCVHYHDGWMRHDWFTKDGRTEMTNDSMLVTFNYDPGRNIDFGA